MNTKMSQLTIMTLPANVHGNIIKCHIKLQHEMIRNSQNYYCINVYDRSVNKLFSPITSVHYQMIQLQAGSSPKMPISVLQRMAELLTVRGSCDATYVEV
jgi:hypothetical protein